MTYCLKKCLKTQPLALMLPWSTLLFVLIQFNVKKKKKNPLAFKGLISCKIHFINVSEQ